MSDLHTEAPLDTSYPLFLLFHSLYSILISYVNQQYPLESIYFYIVRNLTVLTIHLLLYIQSLLPNRYFPLGFKPLTVFPVTLKRKTNKQKIIPDPGCRLSCVSPHPNPYVEVLTLSTSECSPIYLKIVFKKAIKLRLKI